MSIISNKTIGVYKEVFNVMQMSNYPCSSEEYIAEHPPIIFYIKGIKLSSNIQHLPWQRLFVMAYIHTDRLLFSNNLSLFRHSRAKGTWPEGRTASYLPGRFYIDPIINRTEGSGPWGHKRALWRRARDSRDTSTLSYEGKASEMRV